jgi:hypothetical protein
MSASFFSPTSWAVFGVIKVGDVNQSSPVVVTSVSIFSIFPFFADSAAWATSLCV